MSVSTQTSLIDDLVLVRAPLGLGGRESADTSIRLRTRGVERILQLGSPWFVRSLEALPNAGGPASGAALGNGFVRLCELLKSYGVPAFCSFDTLAPLAAASTPVRYSKRLGSESLKTLELSSADVYELDGWHPGRACWGWPGELGEVGGLATFVQAIRDAAGGITPIGVSLPIGAGDVDLNVCVDANVDFVTLVAEQESGVEAQLLECMSRVAEHFNRDEIHEWQRPAVFLVAQPRDAEQAVKLLALGATAVSIDGLLTEALKSTESHNAQRSALREGILRGIGSAKPQDVDRSPVAELLDGLNSQLKRSMARVGASDLKSFRHGKLAASSLLAQQLSRLPLLGGAGPPRASPSFSSG